MSERKTTRHDARLFRSALSLAKTFVEADLPTDRMGGIEAQRAQLYGVHDDAFKALVNELNVGKEDMRAIWRAARKARAIRERDGY